MSLPIDEVRAAGRRVIAQVEEQGGAQIAVRAERYMAEGIDALFGLSDEQWESYFATFNNDYDVLALCLLAGAIAAEDPLFLLAALGA